MTKTSNFKWCTCITCNNNVILTINQWERHWFFYNFRAVCGRTNNQLLDVSFYHYIGMVSGRQDQTLGYVLIPDNYYGHMMQLVLLQFHLVLFNHNTIHFFLINILLSYNTMSGCLQRRSHNNYIVVSTKFDLILWKQIQM